MPLQGLVAYDGDSDHDDPAPRDQSSGASASAAGPRLTTHLDDHQLSSRTARPSDNHLRLSGSSSTTSSSKPAVIIRRHAPTKPHPRSRLPDDFHDDSGPSSQPPPVDPASEIDVDEPSPAEAPLDELAQIRRLLRPPPIPGVPDWGIPPEPSEPCDEAIKAKVTSFLTLKRDSQNPRHFNDSLMANRAFRNPHLYTKLVEFVDVDERISNFPQHMWDPLDVKDEWYADSIAEAQKARSESTSAAQQPGKRTRIDFSSSSSSTSAQRPRQSAHDTNKHGRHQPYAATGRNGNGGESSGVLGGGYGRGRGRGRWA